VPYNLGTVVQPYAIHVATWKLLLLLTYKLFGC